MRALLEHVVEDSRLQTLHRGVLAIDLAAEFVEKPYTLLAPVDMALLRCDHLHSLFSDPERVEELFDFFHFFLLRGIVPRPSVGQISMATVHGQYVQLGPDFVCAASGRARILETVICKGGLIHLLDAVVGPSSGSVVQS